MVAGLSQHIHTLMHIYQEETREEEKHENQDQKGMNQECMTLECVHDVKRRTEKG